MNKLRVLLNISLMACAGSAFAAQDHAPGQRMLETLDVNGDGLVSLIEFQDRENNVLAMMDADDNGVLTIDEFLNGRPARGERGNRPGDQREPTAEQIARMQEMRTERATARFQMMDTNGDELVTLEEFQAATFAELDRNDDGVLDAEEVRPPRMGRFGPGGHGPGPGDRSPRGQHTRDAPTN